MTTITTTPSDAVAAALGAHPGATVNELAAAAGVGRSTTGKCLVALERAGTATREPGGRDGGRRLPDRWRTRPTRGTTRATAKGANPGRLGKGELGVLVLGYLAEHPKEALGPTAVGKALGRSAGAVSNALDRLDASGQASLVSPSPRRFRFAGR